MKIERPRSLKDLVVDELRQRIIDNRLSLGAPLSENTLAADLGMSKTPVREALQQLRTEGLVQVLPQKGTYVFRIEARDVELISELRAILELSAASLAMERNHRSLVAAMKTIIGDMQQAFDQGDTVAYQVLDGQYHQCFIELCGNPYLTEAFSQIGFRIQALRSRLSRSADLNSRSIADHQAMLEHVEQRDVVAFQALLRAHIDQTRQSYLQVMEDVANIQGDRTP